MTHSDVQAVRVSEDAGPKPDVQASKFSLVNALSAAFGTAGLRDFFALAVRSSTELILLYCGIAHYGTMVAAALAAGAPARIKLNGRQR